jgi:hypothetical protein
MHKISEKKTEGKRYLLFILIGVVFISLNIILFSRPASASIDQSPKESPQNEACLTCHNKPDFQKTLPSGEVLSLTIERDHFRSSVHNSIDCTDCHTEISSFPHPKFTAQTRRDVSLQLYTICQNCHTEQYSQALDSVHAMTIAAGDTSAAICTDCHDPHTQTPITASGGSILPEIRLEIPQKCAQCHDTIYQQYEQSIHGSALTFENNPDVPTCIDCHGIHGIEDPRTAEFYLKSPELCARCHSDETIMDEYGISTDVISTYVADFHGTTVTLFETQSPDQATNKPVCISCHGVHDIKRVDDPTYGLEMKSNLLSRCQQCHPDATSDFPDAWMSHYTPSPEHYPVVYYVNLFYKFFIPGVLIPMGIFVASDIVRRLIDKRKGVKHS